MPSGSRLASGAFLDTLDTHKPGNDRGLKRHPSVAFSRHTDQRVSAQSGRHPVLDPGASFISIKELTAHIDAFIATYIVWTKSHVHTVHQKRLKPDFAGL